MAKQTAPKPAPKPAAAGIAPPYPRNWGAMKPAERQAWMAEHRPGRDPGKPLGAAAPPAPALGVAGDPPPAGDQDAAIPPDEYEQTPTKPDFGGDIVIPGSVIGRLAGPEFLAKLLRSLADALDGLTEEPPVEL